MTASDLLTRRDWRMIRKLFERDGDFVCPNCDGQTCDDCLHAYHALKRLLADAEPRPEL